MRPERWHSTESAAEVIGGVSPRWVRLQIERGRLRARILKTGRRRTYRIRQESLDVFREEYLAEDSREELDGS